MICAVHSTHLCVQGILLCWCPHPGCHVFCWKKDVSNGIWNSYLLLSFAFVVFWSILQTQWLLLKLFNPKCNFELLMKSFQLPCWHWNSTQGCLPILTFHLVRWWFLCWWNFNRYSSLSFWVSVLCHRMKELNTQFKIQVCLSPSFNCGESYPLLSTGTGVQSTQAAL